MRSRGVVGFVSFLFLLAVACAPAREAATPGPTAQYGGITHFAAVAPPRDLNPYLSSGVEMSVLAHWALQPLVRYNFVPSERRPGETAEDYRIDFVVVPYLAERWEQKDPSTYIFYLRRGVKWHDGEEFSAEDVVFTYQYALDPKVPFANRADIASAEKVEALDRYTVRITTKGPSVTFLSKLGSEYLMFVPKHIADKEGVDALKGKMVGTGAFKLKSFDRNKEAILERNTDYWDKGLPYLDGAVVHYGLDASARMAGLVSKQLDIENFRDKKQFEPVQKSLPDLQFFRYKTGYSNALYMKIDKKPFDDVRVRRALNLAVDRHAMFDSLTYGEGIIDPPAMPGTKLGWAIPPEELFQWPGFRKDKTQDLAEARRLMAEAGYPNGFKAKVTYPGSYLTTGPIVEMFVTQLRQIGAEFSPDPQDTAIYNDRLRKGEYDSLMILSTGERIPQRIDAHLPSKGANNTAPIRDARLDELFEKQEVEFDVAKRKAIWREIQKLVYDQAYLIPTVDFGSYVTWQPYLHGYHSQISTQAFMVLPQYTWLEVDKLPAGR